MRRMMLKLSPLAIRLTVAAALLALAACSGVERSAPEDPRSQNPTNVRKQSTGKVFGDDAFVFGGSGKSQEGLEGGGGIGVNSFLWRASLDTLLFMPVTSADPFGGVILTDWYTPSDSPPDQRFKLNVYILGRALRADGVRVGVFRQVREGDSWRDQPLDTQVATKIEDAILTKARQLRNETLRQ
ncbi:MAG: DUF3576 domain-containing protein [Rhodospirillales bacterium]|jgi:hypothetical protein|nr:DUF3576 domain-containing protein [Rhodospirillales bacterium]